MVRRLGEAPRTWVRGIGRSEVRDATALPALLFVGPALLVYALFSAIPIAQTAWLSLTDSAGFHSPAHFVGGANYIALAGDPTVRRVLGQTLLWLVLHLVLAGGTGLILAVAIRNLVRSHVFFRTAFFLPHVVSLAVVGVIWGRIYDPYFGLLSGALHAVGLGHLSLGWLSDPALVIFSVNVASSWQGFGLYMLLFIAGLQNIDPVLYEAAELDGASPFRQFIHVTLPGLAEVMTFVVSLALINGLKGFATVWVMTQGGPFYASELITTYIFKLAFQMQQQGRAAALCVVLCLIAVGTTVAFNRWRERLR
jgi:raffinose/stachyose/melibiose transport system permease protein